LALVAEMSGSRAREPDRPVVTPAVVWKLVDAFQDGVLLADGHGRIALANTRLEELFGYAHGELEGCPVDSLIPAHLQETHRGHRASYAQTPAARPMGAGARLVGLRKDGTTFPAEISLSPVSTVTGQFALAVVRDVTDARRLEDLARHAAAALAAEQAPRLQPWPSTAVTSLFGAALRLQAAIGQPSDVTELCIEQALGHLDDAIREVRGTAFSSGPVGDLGL
jgi:PAS domain S-box-containing protein